MECVVARPAEHGALASPSRCDLLPERRVFHVLELMGVVHFARRTGCATVFARPGMEADEHVGTARRPHGVRQSIECRTQLRKFVEVFQREDLDQPLLAAFRFDTDCESTLDPASARDDASAIAASPWKITP